MSECFTIARPYAKAAFDFAVERNSLDLWEDMLKFSTEVAQNKKVMRLFHSSIAKNKIAELFISICEEKLNENGKNFIRIIAENSRLHCLPSIYKYFKYLQEKNFSITKVEITSAYPLNQEQILKIKTIMERRLLKKVNIHFKINKSIIAGIIIRSCSDNMIIDGSLYSRIKQLADSLQS